jgi:Fuc2NAc and GlcNAc transferase
LIYVGLFFLSLFLTYIIKYYTIKKEILDIPNERSSHKIAVPRGGGLAIIFSFYVGLIFFQNDIDEKLFLALFSAMPIVIVSIIDDIKSVSSKIRLLVQTSSAFLALYFLGGINNIDFIFFELTGWWLNILAFFTIIWLTNLYNFLDGIDGYAASQTITFGLGLFIFLNHPLGGVLLFSSLGFLVFNWHKASIFMGDVGSASLGFIIAIILFSDTNSGNIYFGLITLSLFLFDATITLIRRYKNGEKITEAHKKHAYQRLVQSGWSHASVTLGLIGFNSLFLFLLYFVNWEILFIVNLMCLFIIFKFVDATKRFN